jgi:hypothetical protein
MNVSPWNLTPREAAALDAAARYGAEKQAARALGGSLLAYRNSRYRAFDKMRESDPALTPERCLYLWVRWRVGNPTL